MNSVLLTAGVVALMAAVIGGGLKAFNIEIGPLSSRGVRLTLGLLGIAFIGAAVILRDDAGDSGNGGKDRYQRQVLATCNSVRKVVARNDLGPPQLGPGGFTFDRDALVSTGRANLAAVDRRLTLLLDKPAPDSLRGQAKVVRERKGDFVEQNRQILSQLKRTLPERFTVEEFNAITSPLQDTADKVLAQLEDALSQLAGRACSVSTS